MFLFAVAFFVVLIVANIFADYVSWKAVGVCVLLVAVSLFIPWPNAAIVVVALLDVFLLIKFKAEYS